MVTKINTTKYIHLRDKKILKLVLDNSNSLFNILYKVFNEYYELGESKKFWSIILMPYSSLINDYIMMLKIVDNNELPISEPQFEVPIDGASLRRMGINFFPLANSINFIKKLFKEKKLNCNLKFKIYHENENFKQKKISFTLLNFFFGFQKKKIILDLFNLELFIRLSLKGYSPNYLNYNKERFHLNSFDIKKRLRFYELGLKFCTTEIMKEDWCVVCFLLPISIIENYNFYKKKSEQTFSIKPDKIIVSNLRGHELENMWFAKQNSAGCSLELYQYGFGHFYQKFESDGSHELDMCDRYYSWAKSKKQNTIKIPFFRNFKTNNNQKINGIVLINSSWTYFYKNGCYPIFEQNKKNFFDEIKFLNIIRKVFSEIYIKDTNYKYIYYDKKIISKNNIKFSVFNREEIYNKNNLEKLVTTKSWQKLIAKGNIFPVCSYIGTTFLELMANDIPHLLFYRPSHFNVNENFKKYINQSREFNFTFVNPVNGAKFINENYLEIKNLWNKKNFINFRKEFRNEFCSKDKNWKKSFSNLII